MYLMVFKKFKVFKVFKVFDDSSRVFNFLLYVHIKNLKKTKIKEG